MSTGGTSLALFAARPLREVDLEMVAQLSSSLETIREAIGVPAAWHHALARVTRAAAVRGSTGIEGYDVSAAEALRVDARLEPAEADGRSWAEVQAYATTREAFKAQLSTDPAPPITEAMMLQMHAALLGHRDCSPGAYRSKEVWVSNERGEITLTPPPAEQARALMGELGRLLARGVPRPGLAEVLVQAGLAHLNLAMIHPFRDGNGRMARLIQTMVLARELGPAAAFLGVEEWLGDHVEDYYGILRYTGSGHWDPGQSTRWWTTFMLRAHHAQAQTVLQQIAWMAQTNRAVTELLHRVPELPHEVLTPVMEVALGVELNVAGYQAGRQASAQGAGAELGHLIETGVFAVDGSGELRPGPWLRDITHLAKRDLPPVRDPAPQVLEELGVARSRRRRP